MSKKDKMIGKEITYLDYICNLIYPHFRPPINGLPPPPIDGISGIGVGSKVYIYVKDESVLAEVQAALDADYQEEKEFIEIKITGEIVIGPAILQEQD
jgi:hypothetical protein